MRSITVTRNKGWYGVMRKARLMADDVEIASIASGETVTVQVPQTAKHLYVKMDWGRSHPYPIRELEEGHQLYMNGWFPLNPLRAFGILEIPIALEDKPR